MKNKMKNILFLMILFSLSGFSQTKIKPSQISNATKQSFKEVLDINKLETSLDLTNTVLSTKIDSSGISSSLDEFYNKTQSNTRFINEDGDTITGTILVPTPAAGTNTTQIANTAFVVQNSVHTIWPFDEVSSGLPINTTGDTNEHTILTITIPANSIGSNGRLDFIGAYSMNSNTNTKYLKIYINGDASQIVTAGNSASTGLVGTFWVKMWNRNSKSSQWILPTNASTGAIIGWAGTLSGAGSGLTKNYNTAEASP